MRKLFITLLIATFLAAPADAALINGSFETGTNPPTGGFITLPAAGTAITGWTVISGSIDWIGSYWQPYDGQRSIDLAGNGAGTITTSFATTPSATYTVSFYLSGNYDGNTDDPVRTAIVSVNGGAPISFDFTRPDGWRHDNMGWVERSFSFTASGTSTTLAFSSGEGSSPYGPAIDNIRVVPIPAAAYLLGSGLLGLVVLRRRMKK